MRINNQRKNRLLASPVKHYPLPRRLVDRQDYILSHCVNKRVLHVGFADFSSTGDLEVAVNSSGWLHRKIQTVAGELIGLDSASAAVEQLKAEFGVKGIYVGDAERLDLLDKGLFDVIVAGEIIEHLPCPGSFLASARRVLEENGSLIITGPNAFCLRKLLQVARGRESVHEDHVAYYSHSTLYRLAQLFEYQIEEQCSYRLPNSRPLFPYIVERFACLISPNLGEGIIARLIKK